MTLPFTITIASAEGDRLRAETPAGPIEAASLGELGDRLKEVLVQMEADADADDLAELDRLSRSALGQDALLKLARTSPPPPSWYDEHDD
jgi:hypothetical protein